MSSVRALSSLAPSVRLASAIKGVPKTTPAAHAAAHAEIAHARVAPAIHPPFPPIPAADDSPPHEVTDARSVDARSVVPPRARSRLNLCPPRSGSLDPRIAAAAADTRAAVVIVVRGPPSRHRPVVGRIVVIFSPTTCDA
jgi:hypothetical protein